jgi:hypothetical protein
MSKKQAKANVITKTVDSSLSKIGVFATTVVTSLIVISIVALVCSVFMDFHQSKHPSLYTVKITDLGATSGGSGVILSSSETGSIILTNNHVCGVLLRNGGKVTTYDRSEYVVVSIKLDSEADLCEILVAANLGVGIKVAKETPATYSHATVTGHPMLMRNIITKGHFSHNDIIQLVWGMRPCTIQDKMDPANGMACIIMGGIPIVRSFDARVISATIMPGSSGSAVLNDDNELSGLVFAGNQQGMSYGYMVPLNAIHRFIRRANKMQPEVPWNRGNSPTPGRQESMSDKTKQLREICNNKQTNQDVINMCRSFNVEALGELL